MSMRKMGFLLVASVLVVGMAADAFADAYVWTGAEDGYWTNRANWTLNGAVPSRAPGVPFSEMTKVNNYYWTASAAPSARC